MTPNDLDFDKMVEEGKRRSLSQQHDTENGIMINLLDDGTVDGDFLATKKKPSTAC